MIQTNRQAVADATRLVLTRFQLALVLLFAPLFLFPSLRFVPLLFVLPLMWIAAAFVDGEPVPSTPLNASLAVMAVMVLISVWATPDIAFSLPKITGVLLGIGMFFGVVRFVVSDRLLNAAIRMFSICGGAFAVVGIFGTDWIIKVPGVSSVALRIPSLIRGLPGQAEGFQPNAIAGTLLIFIPVQLAIVLTAGLRRSDRSLHGAMLALSAGTLVLTQSRGAWLAFAVAMLSWLAWEGTRSRRIAAILTALVIVTVITFGGIIGRTLLTTVGKGLRNDVHDRLELWSSAVAAIGDFPITGMGMNMFRRVVPVLYPTFFTSPDADVAHAHNHLLQAALDLGIPGLVAYLALWLGAAALLFRSRASVPAAQRLCVSGFSAALLAHFLFGTTDAIALGAKFGIFFWIALALVVSRAQLVARVT